MRPHTAPRSPVIRLLAALLLGLLAPGVLGQNASTGLFRVNAKPPTLGYVSASPQAIEPDLIDVPMIARRQGFTGATIPLRAYATLRRFARKLGADELATIDSEPTAYIHIARDDATITYAVHTLDEEHLALRPVDSPDQGWRIASEIFGRAGVSITPPASAHAAQLPQQPGQGSFEWPLAHVQSPTVLDAKTRRARIKVSYPELTRVVGLETFRVRLPKGYEPSRPAGVLVWISPSPDGRIPTIFAPVLDELGLIAIGVDNNGNNRSITDRLQNHLDSIQTIASTLLIDRERIYLSGLSGGGRCSGILQCGFPDLFAGAVPIVGLDTYHNTPTGQPRHYWPRHLAKPSSPLMKLLRQRRIGAITGTADANEPEMSARAALLKRDGVNIRLDVIEGMAHTMPDAEHFTETLRWVDEPRREAMAKNLEEATERMASYTTQHDQSPPSTPAMRRALIEIASLAPYTEPAWRASALLGYPRPEP